MAKIRNSASQVVESRAEIGTNSVTFVSGNLVSLASGFLTNAVATGAIVGVCNEDAVMASDNQTVAKTKVSYTAAKDGAFLVEVACNSASLAQADVGSYFNLTTGQVVDYSTKTANRSFIDTTSAAAVDPVVTAQLKLVKYVGQNTSLYEIVIA